MVIRWTEEAEVKIDEIYRFYEKKSTKVAKEIFADILNAVEPLVLHSKMAPIEPLLEHRPEKFRSLLVRKIFKIVYFISDEHQEIVITTIFDCRQNPKKLEKQLDSRDLIGSYLISHNERFIQNNFNLYECTFSRAASSAKPR